MRYAQIRSMDVSNGEGIGVALFVQGCRFHCKNCFNTEAWDFNGGKEWTPEVKEEFLKLIDKSHIKRVSLLGGDPLMEENLDGILDLVSEINKRYNIPQDVVADDDSNHNILTKNADEIRLSSTKKTIWIYSGYTWEQIMNPVITDDFNPKRDELIKKRQDIIKNCNVFVDGRYVDELRDLSLAYRGSSNQRVINVQETFKQNKIILYCD